MQNDESKKGKIAGIPYVVILFLAVATLPALISDAWTRHDVAKVNSEVLKLQQQKAVVVPTVAVTPIATPSATVAPVKYKYYPPVKTVVPSR